LLVEVIDMVGFDVAVIAFCWLLMAGLGLVSVAWLKNSAPERVPVRRDR
jgi:hypothetical protein